MIGTQSAPVSAPQTQVSNPARASAGPSRLGQAIERIRRYLLSRQAPDGHWVGELQGDTILESEYILLLAFLGSDDDDRIGKAARYIRQQQMPDGGWSNYPDGPADLSVSVKAYFALKIAGYSPSAPYMRRARKVILELGGAARCNSFTKFYLALLGQIPYSNCPAVPPEMILLPRWLYFNLYALSSWTRTIVVPLSIFYAYKPVRRLPSELGITELFPQPPGTPLWPHDPSRRLLTWTNFFLIVDWLIKHLDSHPMTRLRRLALDRAEKWLREHFAGSDGVGAIFPPMIYTVLSLHCRGYRADSPEMRWALKQLDDLIIEERDTIRLQPCFSPVWDTALTTIALSDAGCPNRTVLERASRWLLEREIRQPGDWTVLLPGLEPGGWCFEYRNSMYPDTDDTAMVLMALAKTGAVRRPEGKAAVDRGIRWLLGLQNKDGGWAAFDRGITREVFTKIPFADHNAMLDPSCPDITARVLEALGHFDCRLGDRAVDRAMVFLRQTQELDGKWPGRWGVNYLYGTWQVLTGLAAIGSDMHEPMAQRGVAWLKSVQQPGGGWGETCRSYDDPRLAGQGVPTASQTAWALLGLIAAGEADSDEVRAGVDYLLATQRPDGRWDEDQFTGTGFPKVFYLKYHMYPLYFPLMALARYAEATGQKSGARPSSRSHAERRRDLCGSR